MKDQNEARLLPARRQAASLSCAHAGAVEVLDFKHLPVQVDRRASLE